MPSRAYISENGLELNKKGQFDHNLYNTRNNKIVFTELRNGIANQGNGRRFLIPIAVIKHINSKLNTYEPDSHYQDYDELWNISQKHVSDIEGLGYAVAKYFALIRVGIKPKKLKILIGTTTNSHQAIAVLEITRHSKKIYLKKDSSDILSKNKLLEDFTPLFYEPLESYKCNETISEAVGKFRLQYLLEDI